MAVDVITCYVSCDQDDQETTIFLKYEDLKLNNKHGTIIGHFFYFSSKYMSIFYYLVSSYFKMTYHFSKQKTRTFSIQLK